MKLRDCIILTLFFITGPIILGVGIYHQIKTNYLDFLLMGIALTVTLTPLSVLGFLALRERNNKIDKKEVITV